MSAIDPFVFTAVLMAAALHAGWNAVLKLRIDPFLAMTLVTGMAGLVALPPLVYFGFPRSESWIWLAASVALHMGYYLALTEAYRRGDMSQVYPIARGVAPLLTTLLSFLLLREPIALQAAFGIAVLVGGVALMSFGGPRRAGLNRGAIGFALLTAGTICGYTLVDGLGARAAGDPHAYATAMFVIDGVPLVVFALWRHGIEGLRPAFRYAWAGLAGGAMSVGSYWIAIWAMTLAPIALVAALRETSVLWGALIAVVVLKEPLVPARALAALGIVAGLLLIRLQ